jgi:hypothetical protein
MGAPRPAAKTFRDLLVWRKAHDFVILADDLDYGDTRPLMNRLEEVSRLLHAYAAAILDSDS